LNPFLSFFKLLPPELAHFLALSSLKLLHKFYLLPLFFKQKIDQEYNFLNLKLANRLGTAAGLDKNGDFIDCLGALGFGFLEIGTITPLAQKGNPKPRVFRIFKENAVINRLGFNNKGVDYLVERLKKRKFNGIVGVNIGANKKSSGQDRINDYLVCFRKVYKYCDYITVNISSPNTPNLRELHDPDNLINLLDTIEEEIIKLNYNKPVFLKISPDESEEALKLIVQLVEKSIFSGLVATNTTINKNNLKNSDFRTYSGGLSGEPLMTNSTKTIKYIKSFSPDMKIIGVGGVMSQDDFNKKLDSGASLVQVYTGFIIHGPKIVSELLK
jgi:dihydroorotate dehydrogenase